MLALGVIDESRSTDLFAAEAAGPVRPGRDAPLLRTAGRPKGQAANEVVAAAVLAGAELARDRARKLADVTRSSITLAALAQTHAVLGEHEKARLVAREALDLSLVETPSSDDETQVADPASARLAAEVMVRFGQALQVLEMLNRPRLPKSLRMTSALIAAELGQLNEAASALEGLEGELVESMRGFLWVAQGEYQKAIPHLRRALREDPGDAAAAMNLSVSLWGLGAHRKAIATALRASRTAPGRRDLSLHYLELLLADGQIYRLSEQIAALNNKNVVADAQFLVIQARALIAKGDLPRAVQLLDEAGVKAGAEGNSVLRVEIAANLTALRYWMKRLSRDKAIEALSKLLRDHPDHQSVVMSFARIASLSSEAPALRRAVTRVSGNTTVVRRAFLDHQLAWLEGDNNAAGSAAAAWFDAEPRNAQAAATALVAIGIGQERWEEAATVADFALAQWPDDLTIVNNSAYTLAMAGRANQAIRLLEPLADTEFVAKATLGLAHLANGDVDRGMRLYREAAKDAEKADATWHSLMTVYQALVVRQLGLDKSEAPEVISALALATVPLPTDWMEQPDFVRLRNVCTRRGYRWPLTL